MEARGPSYEQGHVVLLLGCIKTMVIFFSKHPISVVMTGKRFTLQVSGTEGYKRFRSKASGKE
jgi:hypothetical protein